MKNYKSFSNTNNIWNAHKMRNTIAHELNFNINDINAKFDFEYYIIPRYKIKFGINNIYVKENPHYYIPVMV